MDDTTAAAFEQETGSAATLDAGATAERMHDLGSAGGQNGKEDPLHQILAAVVAFRDGDFSVRLPLAWPGVEGRIAEAFNQTIAHEQRISDEVTRLSVTVGKEGRLRQRLSLPVAVGSWAHKIHSINTLI